MCDQKPARKILIVDDHAFVRQGLRDFIEREPDLRVCGEAASRAEALQCCAELHPDLVLVDLSLGGDLGLDLIKDISIQFPSMKTLVLSMQDEMLYSERALRAGSSGYVAKSAHPDILIEAVRCVFSGGIFASEAVKQKMLKRVFGSNSEQDPVFQLSDRELAVFEQIGNGLTTVDIADAMHLSVKTVETYRARIKTKLGANNSAELVQRAVQWVLKS